MLLNKFLLKKAYSTLTTEQVQEWNKVKSVYSKTQLKTIFEALNESNFEKLKRLNVSEYHANLFTSMKNNDQSVNELRGMPSKSKKSNIAKYIVSPGKLKNISEVNSVVGIRFGIQSIAWTNIILYEESRCEVAAWDCHTVTEASLSISNQIDIVKQGIEMAMNIPKAGAYVLQQDLMTKANYSKKSSTQFKFLMQQQQLSSAILASIFNKNIKNSNKGKKTDDENEIIHTLRPFVTSKLFELNFGNEVVASSKVVETLLTGERSPWLKKISSVTESEETSMQSNNDFMDHEKEELYKSMLSALAFYELIILNKS